MKEINKENIIHHFTLSSHDLYRKKRRAGHRYQILFFSFSLLFFVLALLIFFFSPNENFSVIFHQNLVLKILLASFAFILGIGSCCLAYSLQPTKHAAVEIIHKQVERAERQISDLYRRKKIKLGFTQLAPSRKNQFKNNYYRTLDKIERQQEKALLFLETISFSSLSAEWMIHQIILELNEKLDKILFSFHQSQNLHALPFDINAKKHRIATSPLKMLSLQ